MKQQTKEMKDKYWKLVYGSMDQLKELFALMNSIEFQAYMDKAGENELMYDTFESFVDCEITNGYDFCKKN